MGKKEMGELMEALLEYSAQVKKDTGPRGGVRTQADQIAPRPLQSRKLPGDLTSNGKNRVRNVPTRLQSP